MRTLSEQLIRKEQVEEDIYFAKRDRELIEALRKKRRARKAALEAALNRPERDRRLLS